MSQKSAMNLRRTWRPWAWAAGALVVFAVATALATPSATSNAYDPDSAAPSGTRAVAELLRAEGIVLERTTDAERAMTAGEGQTLVVAYPALLPREAVQQLEASEADVVLLQPVSTPAGYLGVRAESEEPTLDREPTCELPAATSAGSARMGGVSLDTSGSELTTVECYVNEDAKPSLVQLTTANGSMHTVIGSAEFMTNEWLDDSGNAALAMNTLGSQGSVLWWLPSPAFTGTEPLTSLLPDRVWPILAAVMLLVVCLALWQGRRLGPVVVEPLPVAVRASETTEGRARLYQRHRTRHQAAHHLRGLACAELCQRLGLSPGSEQSAVVGSVASSTGRPRTSVARLLYGPPPESDADLVALGRDLSALDQEVRRA